MEIFFNELSILPQCIDDQSARQKIITLLETMKLLKKHNFNKIRTHENFYAEDLGNGYTFSRFITDPHVSSEIKLLLLSIIENPYIPSDESYEAEVFINHSFETTDHLGNVVLPEGLAVAYVNSLPTLSLTGCPVWEKPTLSLKITDSVSQISVKENIINLSNSRSLGSNEFSEWIKSITVEIELNSQVNIEKLFPPPRYQFENKAISDILSWFYDDKRYLVRIKELLEDIVEHPFVGGKGKTELLSEGGKVSKRIVRKDRIVYSITKEKITIHQCKGHYNSN